MAERAAGCALAALLFFCGCVTTPAPRPPVVLKGHPEPDVQGVTHVVKPGETLWRIARSYQVSVEDVSIANHLPDDARLAAGQELFIPGAHAKVEVPPSEAPPPAVKPIPQGDAPLAWPLVGVLYARFGPRGDTRHDGIDIAAPAGTEVLSAGDGDVVFAGAQKGYGFVVIVQHASGLLTLYAHNQAVLVKDGEKVRTGQPIAKVGETSKTSGPHIHFEVRQDGTPKDPLRFLPAPR